jgi:hypothetical protein
MTPDASTRRQSLQRGEPPQRAALGTRATHWLPNAQCPMLNAQCPMPNAQFPIPNPQLTPQHLFHPNLAGKL